ncbi:hypothetical protein [Streptomyces sp. NBC_00299]|uniref:hypothetical protein n=1 Tax=Streptomyces sp. NBC_00299 TaxID=2975705 RepID=UPI002E2E0962|nr:hypothetical protein [Streptomyces sp. NBC_00299]
MSSADIDTERMKELERLIDKRAMWSVIETCSSLLDWLPAARVPTNDTPANRARAFHNLLREIIDDAQAAYEEAPEDSAARNTLAIGALLGLVTWGPKQPKAQSTRPADSKEVRQGLAGSWLEPPVQANTIRRREHKARLLTEFWFKLYDYIESTPQVPGEPVRSDSGGREQNQSDPTAFEPDGVPAFSTATARPTLRRPTPLARLAGHQKAVVAGAVAVVLGVAALLTWRLLPTTDEPDDPVSIDDVARAEGAGSFVLPLRLDLAPAQLEEINHDKYWQGGAGHVESFTSWFTKQKGVWAENSLVNVTLSGAADKTVRITRIDVDKRNCRAPAGGGTLFYAPVGGSGEDENITFLFDLDLPQPVARDEDGEDYFSRRAITLKPGEAETLSLFVSTRRQDCEYVFRLRVVVPGSKQAVTRTIPEQGSPAFRLTALAKHSDSRPYSAYRALYVGGAASPAQGAFVQADPLAYNDDPATLSQAP